MARALGKHGALTALHKHYPEDELTEFFAGPDGAHAFYSLGHDVGRPQEARGGGEVGADPAHLHRRRQRIRGKIPRVRQARPRRPPGSGHHGGQRRDRRHDRSADHRRRRHRQDRHWSRVGLHHPAGDRRRIPPAFGDHRMRRRRARPQRARLRRRRLHRAWRHRQGLRRRGGFRHARRHARRPRRVRRRRPLRGARRREGRCRHVVLRHVLRDRDEEIRRAASPITGPPKAKRSRPPTAARSKAR